MPHVIPPARNCRIGIIGLGGIWSKAHAPAIASLRERGWPIDVVAGADPDPARRADAAQLFPGMRLHPTGMDLLAEPLDLLIIATWPPLSAELASAACGRVPRILVEKPVAHDPQIISALAARARATGTVVEVAYNRRSLPLLATVRDALRLGGPVRHWSVRFWRGWRQEAGFYADVLGHPLSLLTAVAGPLTVDGMRTIPGTPIAQAVVAHGRAGAATWELDCRPATGLHSETYEALQDRRTVRWVYRPIEDRAEPSGVWVAEDGDWRELETVPGEVVAQQGFVEQMARAIDPRSVAGCTLEDAEAIMRLIGQIDPGSNRRRDVMPHDRA